MELGGNCPELVMKVGGVLDDSGVEKSLKSVWSKEC